MLNNQSSRDIVGRIPRGHVALKISSVGVSIVAQHFKLLLEMPASHLGTNSSPGVVLLILGKLWRVVQVLETLISHMGDLDKVPPSGLWPSSVLAIATTVE